MFMRKSVVIVVVRCLEAMWRIWKMNLSVMIKTVVRRILRRFGRRGVGIVSLAVVGRLEKSGLDPFHRIFNTRIYEICHLSLHWLTDERKQPSSRKGSDFNCIKGADGIAIDVVYSVKITMWWH